MSRLTYWLMRDWDEYVDMVRTRLDAGEVHSDEDVVQVLVAVAEANSLGVTSGAGELPAQSEKVEGLTPLGTGQVALLRGGDKQLPTDLWDRALLMRTLAWTSWPAVLVTATD
ncbi:MAG: hypothetical protein QOK42_1971 [Frankiaceae bacterium]|jgi:hypothetical protein|nr:hypothetical protein [Frankiaceae bacterium]MDX6274502.1 hypothetical protein [Frankiales bacterium]